MKKNFLNKKAGWLFLLVIPLFVFIQIVFLQGKNNERRIYRASAGECGGGLPPAIPGGVQDLQQKINTARNGDTIIVSRGTYMDPQALPLGLGDGIAVSAARGGASTCMLRIEGKTLTLKGEDKRGSIIYGEGHARPYQDPYQNRAGICLINSNVTIDNLTLKEFQKRTVVAYDSSITVKNSIVEGSDEGGVSLLNNSSGLFVNNFFVSFNFGSIMLWQNSVAKVINNEIIRSHIMFFFHPGTPDTANATIINNIFTGGGKITQVDWWTSEAGKLQNITARYNLFGTDSSSCNPANDYCTQFPGKVIGDPLYQEPVVDMCGIAGWANFTLKEGSPALGGGDPSIPGPRNLGTAGGPCFDPNSATCTSYISANKPTPPPVPTQPPQPTIPGQPTSPPVPTLPPGTIYPTVTRAVPTLIPTSTPQVRPTVIYPTFGYGTPIPTVINPTTGLPYPTFPIWITPPIPTRINPTTPPFFYPTPTQAPFGGLFNWFAKPSPIPTSYTHTITFENVSTTKTFKIRYLTFGNEVKGIEKDLKPKEYLIHDFGWNCTTPSYTFLAGFLFTSSKDNHESQKFKNLSLSCDKREVVDLE